MDGYKDFSGTIIYTMYTGRLNIDKKIDKLTAIRRNIASAYLQGVIDKTQWKHLTLLCTDCLIKLKEEK